jgi:hypothetical protein
VTMPFNKSATQPKSMSSRHKHTTIQSQQIGVPANQNSMGRGRKKGKSVRGQKKTPLSKKKKKTQNAYVVAAPAPFGCGTISCQGSLLINMDLNSNIFRKNTDNEPQQPWLSLLA